MSNKISSIIQTKKIGSSTKKAILMYMADKASDDGTGIWVSKSNMAADLEMTDRAVRQHIKEMLGMNIIKEAGQRKCRYGYTVDYSINIAAISLLESTRSTPELHSPLNDIHPHPCTTFSGTPEPRSDKPSLEPSLEPNILSSSDDNDLDLFERVFWSKYPKKVGKKAALKSFKSVMKQVDRGKVHYGEFMTGFEKYVASMQGKDLQYVKHFATWLNGEHWNDEV